MAANLSATLTVVNPPAALVPSASRLHPAPACRQCMVSAFKKRKPCKGTGPLASYGGRLVLWPHSWLGLGFAACLWLPWACAFASIHLLSFWPSS